MIIDVIKVEKGTPHGQDITYKILRSKYLNPDEHHFLHIGKHDDIMDSLNQQVWKLNSEAREEAKRNKKLRTVIGKHRYVHPLFYPGVGVVLMMLAFCFAVYNSLF